MSESNSEETKLCLACHEAVDINEEFCICGFSFGSNRCTDPECGKPCGDYTCFCESCGSETVNYLDGLIPLVK